MIQQQSNLMPAPPAGGAWTYTSLFVVMFIVFLVIAVAAQLLTLQWRPLLPGSEGEGSFINNVRSSVYTVMSYIP